MTKRKMTKLKFLVVWAFLFMFLIPGIYFALGLLGTLIGDGQGY